MRKEFKKERSKDEFNSKLLDVARVARVVAGGRRFSFRSVVVVGDKKGKVGVGVGKGADVSDATTKAVADAKKNLITVNISEDSVVDLAGIKNVTSKILGSANKLNNARATILALKKLKSRSEAKFKILTDENPKPKT